MAAIYKNRNTQQTGEITSHSHTTCDNEPMMMEQIYS